MEPSAYFVIDDLKAPFPLSALGTRWRFFTDQVMGGVSRGSMVREDVAGRPAIRMRGDVSLENNGGFIQISLDLAPDEGGFDATSWKGLEIDVYGRTGDYEVRLRTAELSRPWQSYRHIFRVMPEWGTLRLPFDSFRPNRTETPLSLSQLRRVGLLAYGKAFAADLALGGIRFYA